MFCPKCGQEQFCPCPTCSKREPHDIYYKQIEPSGQACSKCGLTKDMAWWDNLEWDIFEDDRKDQDEFEFIKHNES